MNNRQYSINEHTHTHSALHSEHEEEKKESIQHSACQKPMNNDTQNEIQIIHFSCSWCPTKWAHLYIESSNLYLIFWNCNNNFSVSFIPLSFGNIESWISCSVICEMSLWFIWFNFYLFLHIYSVTSCPSSNSTKLVPFFKPMIAQQLFQWFV